MVSAQGCMPGAEIKRHPFRLKTIGPLVYRSQRMSYQVNRHREGWLETLALYYHTSIVSSTHHQISIRYMTVIDPTLPCPPAERGNQTLSARTATQGYSLEAYELTIMLQNFYIRIRCFCDSPPEVLRMHNDITLNIRCFYNSPPEFLRTQDVITVSSRCVVP